MMGFTVSWVPELDLNQVGWSETLKSINSSINEQSLSDQQNIFILNTLKFLIVPLVYLMYGLSDLHRLMVGKLFI